MKNDSHARGGSSEWKYKLIAYAVTAAIFVGVLYAFETFGVLT